MTKRHKSYTPKSSIIGVSGATIVDGRPITKFSETPILSNRYRKHLIFREMIRNIPIISAGLRYYLNMVAKAQWTFSPAATPEGQKYASIAKKMLKEDPYTSFQRIMRTAAMYRFWGFSVQEWIVKRDEKTGILTLKDIQPRPQHTIYKWEIDKKGEIKGVIQKDPVTSKEYFIPRGKLLYLVDDSVDTSPEGSGVLEDLVSTTDRLRDYQHYERAGFRSDLNGIPLIRMPLERIESQLKRGLISKEDYDKLIYKMTNFAQKHMRGEQTSMLLDSVTYQSQDEAGRPSTVYEYDIDLVKGGSVAFRENAQAIERLNREIARVLGVEQMMLGSDSNGSLALSRDKTDSFFLTIDTAVSEIKDNMVRDILIPLWQMNGFDIEDLPKISTEATRLTDVEAMARTIKYLSDAGMVNADSKASITEIYETMGLSPPDFDNPPITENLTE